MLFGVLLASKYLLVDSLMSLCACKIATLLRGRTPREVRERFHVLEPASADVRRLGEDATEWALGVSQSRAR